MASKGRSVPAKPLDWAAFYERVKLARQLVNIGSEQLKKAKLDFDLASVGLAEIEAELTRLGVATTEGGE